MSTFRLYYVVLYGSAEVDFVGKTRMDLSKRWLADLRRGDPAAYETLVRRFEGPIYRYFLSSHGNPQLAGEQSADCFGELVQAIPRMAGGPELLRPFVFGVARNVLRRGWRHSRGSPLPLECAGHAACGAPSPDVNAELRDELRHIFEALQELDPKTRDVFILRYIEELSLAEVASLVGEPLGTIKSRVHRGRRILKTIVGRAEKT